LHAPNNPPRAKALRNAPDVASFALVRRVLTGAADEGFGSRDVSIVEPRIPCPRCGAHVLVEGRAVDHLLLLCPVCGLTWDEPRRPRPNE